MIIIALQNRRTASATKTPPLPWRGFPLSKQLTAGNETKRGGRHGSVAGECCACRFATLTTVTVGYGSEISIDLVPNTTTKTGTFKHLSSFRARRRWLRIKYLSAQPCPSHQ